MEARIRLGLAVVLSALVVVPAALASGSGGSAASLTGETLIASELGDPGTSTVAGTCNPLGTSTFDFTVTGVAFGPYPGTFTESGRMTFGPFGVIGQGIFPASFSSTFTINSPVATVYGWKKLAQPVSTGRGLCGEFAFEGGQADAILFEGDLKYAAIIGNKVDYGDSFISYQDTQLRGVPDFNGFAFDESFVSSAGGGDGDDDDDDDDD